MINIDSVHEKAEKHAATLLKKHSIQDRPIPVEEIAKKEGLRLAYHELEDDVSGFLLRDNEASVLAVNMHHHPNRQRFTIAHELGHYKLHFEEPSVFVDGLLLQFRATSPTKKQDINEIEANAFAAALLIPSKLIKKDLKQNPIDLWDEDALYNLASKYKVSTQALTIRLKDLGFLSDY